MNEKHEESKPLMSLTPAKKEPFQALCKANRGMTSFFASVREQLQLFPEYYIMDIMTHFGRIQ